MRQIALIGMGPSAEQAPSGNNWERWGIALAPDWPTYDVAFEMHDDLNASRLRNVGDYESRLRDIGMLYVQRGTPAVPDATPYPFKVIEDELFADVPEDCRYGSTLAYMLALAIVEDPVRISLYGFELNGFDAANKPYDHQRHNVAFLIGVAIGRYIRVDGPSLPEILALPIDGERYGVN